MKISKACWKKSSGIAHQLHGAIGMTHEHQLHHVSKKTMGMERRLRK